MPESPEAPASTAPGMQPLYLEPEPSAPNVQADMHHCGSQGLTEVRLPVGKHGPQTRHDTGVAC